MIHRTVARAARLTQLAVAIAACTPMGNNPSSESASATGLTAEQRAAGWRALFDGTSTAAWRGYKQQNMPAGWSIVDGVLTKTGSVGDIITRDQFGNFQLALDWKLSPGGNAGVFYRGTEEYDHIYWSAPEYQLLDDAAAPDAKDRLTAAGAAYALYPSPAGIVKPAGEWKTPRTFARRPRRGQPLNGQKPLHVEPW